VAAADDPILSSLFRAAGGDAAGVASALTKTREAGFLVHHVVDALLGQAERGEQDWFEEGHNRILVNPAAIAVGLYMLRIQLTHSLKGAWFQPLNLSSENLVSPFDMQLVPLHRGPNRVR
jgi:hypothetical protein